MKAGDKITLTKSATVNEVRRDRGRTFTVRDADPDKGYGADGISGGEALALVQRGAARIAESAAPARSTPTARADA